MTPSEKLSLPSTYYASELERILSMPLSPENIDSYSDNALQQTVEFVEQLTHDYNRQPTIQLQPSAEAETAISTYYGVTDVPEVLDHLAEISANINDLATVIGRAALYDHVIVPPDSRGESIQPGEGSFTSPNVIERFKTTLFILQNSFNVNIHNEQELKIVSGAVPAEIMRNESYYAIEAIPLNRIILVCNEEGNVSYVVNVERLHGHNVTTRQLVNSTKAEINELLAADSKLGTRLIYSPHFTERMRDLIINPEQRENNTIPASRPVAYLNPEAVTEMADIKAMSARFNLSEATLRQKIKVIKPLVGDPMLMRRSRGMPAKFYTPEQQAIIEQHLEEAGLLVEDAPELVKPLNQLKQEWARSGNTIKTAIDELKDELGTVTKYNFNGNRDTGYTPEQQAIIKNYLDQKYPLASESYLTGKAIADKFKADKATVYRVIDEIRDSLGVAVEYWNRSDSSPHYSSEQQEMIRTELERRGEFLPIAPDGYKSRNGFYAAHGVHAEIFDKALELLGDRLGETPLMKFGPKRVPGFSPAQQQMILEVVPLVRKSQHSKP